VRRHERHVCPRCRAELDWDLEVPEAMYGPWAVGELRCTTCGLDRLTVLHGWESAYRDGDRVP
jgi:hypothetical protein